MFINKSKLPDSFHCITDEITKNHFIKSCISRRVNISNDTINAYYSIVDEQYVKDNFIFYLELMLLYIKYKEYFISIGNPKLPLQKAWSLEDAFHYVADYLVFGFSQKDSKNKLQIPNILGYNEPALDPSTTSLEEILRANMVKLEDIFHYPDESGEYHFSNTYLFSEEIDYALDNGYEKELTELLWYACDLKEGSAVYDLAVVQKDSPLHLNHIYERRPDLLKSDETNEITRNMHFKYNIIVRSVEDEDCLEPVSSSPCDFVSRIEDFIKASQLLIKIKNDLPK